MSERHEINEHDKKKIEEDVVLRKLHPLSNEAEDFATWPPQSCLAE